MTVQSQASEIPDAQLPRPGDVVGGKYRVDAFIARGGMGAVLAATHEITGRRIALKWMLPQPGRDAEATHRVVREARAAARVRHPNVVDVYDVGEHDGAMFLVMELLEGETLHARLKASGPLDVRTTLALLVPAMRGVEAAHQAGVIHRDLKPSNIFLCGEPGSSEPTPRVLDFGISKIMSSAGDGEHSLTRTGSVLGTPHYMPSEQLTGDAADERADVYALGVILYQCLTGQLPFAETNYNALVLQIGTATPVTVAELAPHVPRGLSAVVMRAMAREPMERFANVGALIEALLPLNPSFATAKRTRHTTWPVIVAIVGSAFAAFAAWASHARDASNSQRSSTDERRVERLSPQHELSSPARLPAPQTQAVAQQVVDSEAESVAPAAPASRIESRHESGSSRTDTRARQRSRQVIDEPDLKQPVPVSLEQF